MTNCAIINSFKENEKMNANIGSKVKKMREVAGINQEQIARFLNIDQSMISKCESGERQFQIDQLEQLCNLFGCSLMDLVNQESDIKPLKFAFRANSIQDKDFVAIAEVQKIVMNLSEMRYLLEGVTSES